MNNWNVTWSESDGRSWINLKRKDGVAASLSTPTRHADGSEYIASQVVRLFVDDYNTQLQAAADRLTALEAENARLREALEFYADTSKYPAPFTGGLGELYYDCGQVARTALTAPQGGDHGE